MIEIDIPKRAFLPCYQHLIDSSCDINFLWGGRDSGKTHFIAQKLIIDCLEKEYFRCILIKKTYESIKDAQFQTIKDIVVSWNIEHLFQFKESPLEIICVNGNKFIARGCDKPEKMKSISNPSDAWFEEGNQLTMDDYIVVSTTLRSQYGRVKEWFSFNPECEGDYANFWLYKEFFKNVPYNQHTISDRVTEVDKKPVRLTYSSTHTTYKDNPKCPPERIAKLLQLAEIDPYYYQVFTNGKWGKRQIQRPWVHNFNPDRHISERAKFNPNLPVYFSLDFNVEPFVCECAHLWRDGSGIHKHNFKELVIENNGDVHTMCDLMLDTFGPTVMANAIFTGDAMQKKREITQKNNIDAWRIINNRFRLGSRLKVPRGNPKVSENRHLINTVYAFHPDNIIHPDCKKLIFDLRYVESDEEGDIIKKDRNNKAQRSDALDCERYLINSFLYDFLEKYAIK